MFLSRRYRRALITCLMNYSLLLIFSVVHFRANWNGIRYDIYTRLEKVGNSNSVLHYEEPLYYLFMCMIKPGPNADRVQVPCVLAHGWYSIVKKS